MRLTTFIAAVVLAATSSMATGADPQSASGGVLDDRASAAAMLADAVLVRPLGLVATVIGLSLFVVTLPLAVIQGELPREAAQKLVVQPLRFTFTRPLGDSNY